MVINIDDVKKFIRNARYTPGRYYLPLSIGVAFLGLFTWDLKLEDVAYLGIYSKYLKTAIGIIAVFGIGFGCFRLWQLAVAPHDNDEPLKPQPDIIKGASSFIEADAEIFAKLGRDKQLAKLRSFVLNDQIALVAVQGNSGVGKTSLMRAGLTHAVGDKDVDVVYWEALPNYAEEEFLHTINEKLRGDQKNRTLNTLEQVISYRGKRALVIVIDQFEQLSREMHLSIFELLRKSVQKPPFRNKFIVTFRNEYASTWNEFLDEFEETHRMRVGMLPVPHFTPSEAESVLSQLLEDSATTVEKAIVEKIIQAQTFENKVSPVDLGIAALVLHDQAKKFPHNLLTASHFSAMGGESELLKNYLDGVLDAFTGRDEILKSLLRLFNAHSYKRTAEGLTAAELSHETKLNSVKAARIFDRLAAPNIRVLERISVEPIRYRLIHERFIPAVKRLASNYLPEINAFYELVDKKYLRWSDEQHKRDLLNIRQLWRYKKWRNQLSWEKSELQTRYIEKSTHHAMAFTLEALLGASALFLVMVKIDEAYKVDRIRSELRDAALPAGLYDIRASIRSLVIDHKVRVNNLDFLNGSKVTELTVNLNHSRNMKGMVASLTALNLNGADGIRKLDDLPASLTTLNLSSANEIEKLEGLPASLTTLDVSGADRITKLEGLPASLTTLDLSYVDGITKLEGLPASLTTLDLTNSNGIRKLEGLPESLTTLNLSRTNEITKLEGLPASLRTLNLSGTEGIGKLEGLPASLTILDLSHTYFITKLEGLPASLKKLDLSYARGITKLEGLPESLTTLDLSYAHNITKLEGLPASLTTLDLSYAHNITRLEGLPASLTTLDLSGADGIKKLEGLPASLTTLDLSGADGIKKLEGLPVSLTTLDLSKADGIKKLEGLPASLMTLNLSETHKITKLEGLPASLTTLNLSNLSGITKLENLPASLTTLDLTGAFGITKLEGLPASLTTLDLSGADGIKKLEGLPASLTTLDLSYTNGITKLEGLPASLTTLDLSYTNGITKLEGLSASLTTLDLSYANGITKLEGLPPSLTTLDLSYANGITKLEDLPASLRTLDLSYADGITKLDGLPASLTTLDLSHTQGITKLEGLPASLTALKLNSTNITTIEGLPSSVRYLDIRGSKIKSLALLPKNSELELLCIGIGQLDNFNGLPISVKPRYRIVIGTDKDCF